MTLLRTILVLALTAPVVLIQAANAIEQLHDYAQAVVTGSKAERRAALRYARFNKDTQLIAPMIAALRYAPADQREHVATALTHITGKNYGNDWFRWMQWQQLNPEIKPLPGYDRFLARLLGAIDKNFITFIYPGVKSSIALHEVVWGGVAARNGIPPLDHPDMVGVPEAQLIGDNESVFGVHIAGDVRAYPYRYMDWHEMLNDTIGGQPVSLAYCTLCGSGILYATQIDTQEGIAVTLKFGSSGLLYRSNKLMFDEQTNSLWNQFSGRPVVGSLADTNLTLTSLPLVTTTWGEWRAMHPTTLIMSGETGYQRDYTPGKPYGDYRRSGRLMFPASTEDRRLRDKARVFGLNISGAQKVWPLKQFRKHPVINDRVGVIDVVLIGDARREEVRAYRSAGIRFADSSANKLIDDAGQVWQITEQALIHNQQQLSRLPGRLSYWFAWSNTYVSTSVQVAD